MASSLGSRHDTRKKQDSAWEYCQAFKNGEKVEIQCKYCAKLFRGGGIFRLKEHLAGRKGGGGPICDQVPSDVRVLMQQSLDRIRGKQKKKRKEVQQEVTGVGLASSYVDTFANLFGVSSSFKSIRDGDSGAEMESTPSTRQKQDPAWGHCQMIENEERVHIKCNYCTKMFRGGGIHRFKEHLAGRKGGSPICSQVPSDVRTLMQQSLNQVSGKQRKKQRRIPEELNNINSPSADLDTFANLTDVNIGFKATAYRNSIEPSSSLELNQDQETCNGSMDRRKRERTKSIGATGDVNNTYGTAFVSKRNDNSIHLAIGQFLYDIGASLDAVNSVYFQPMINAIVSRGSGVTAPSHNDLRGWILKNSVEEVRNDIDQYKRTWEKDGCSLLVDEWKSVNGRILLSFMVYCSRGTVFLKSVDASSIICSTDALYELLKQVVEEIGADHVLQVITSSEEQYVVVGRRLMDTFHSLYWAPCASHCIDLILEDFGKLEWINKVIEEARSMTRFVYNNAMVLNLMRNFTSGADIVQQGTTRSATNFMTLNRMAQFKLNLQAMIGSQEWMDCPYSKTPGGLAMFNVISNRSFWTSCILIIRLTNPLLRVLRIVGNEKTPAMGYIYAGIYRAKETIKRELIHKEQYIVYWNIIDHRWKQHHLPLHAAGFFLNPKFFYSIGGDIYKEIMSALFDCIERLIPDINMEDNIIKEINSYKSALGDMGRNMAIRARDTLLPVEWWSTYGACCPNLARFAIRVLSQTCSLIQCERNQIPFEQMHGTRNCLERRRLCDLIFVQYNLRLRQVDHKTKEQVSIDPTSFDSINTVEDWIVGNEVCLEDHESSDWMSLATVFSNTMPSGSSIEEVEELGAGFDDSEIFSGLHKQWSVPVEQ